MALIKVEPFDNQLAYTEYGNSKGYPILAQHGLIASIRDGGLFDLLVKQGLRVICAARPGYGESSPKEMDNIGEWGKIVKVLANHLKLEQFDVLGMSSGAPYAYAVAHELKERTRNLYIFSGIPAMYDDAVLAYWPFPVTKNAPVAEMQQLAEELFFSNLSEKDLAQNDIHDSAANHAFGLALDFRLRCMDWGFRLGEIAQPVFMRHARQDTNVPFVTAELTAKMLPHCTLQVEESDVHFSEETLNAFFTSTLLTNLP
jgi:pimeloyl-ACP methyl ester carboxylesterase